MDKTKQFFWNKNHFELFSEEKGKIKIRAVIWYWRFRRGAFLNKILESKGDDHDIKIRATY